MTSEEERVWAYIVRTRSEDAWDIAKACGVSRAQAKDCLDRISSENWREPVPPAFTKADNGKPRMDLIPPEIMWALADVLTLGAAKYRDHNWAVGTDWGRYYAALMRHMVAWWGGEDNDPETGRPHTWHAACCLAFLVAYEQRAIGTDNRPTNKDTNHAGMAQEESLDLEVAQPRAHSEYHSDG